MAEPPSATERIGRYRIESVVGRGAMGVIYRAHDPAIDRKVAIKLVRADLLDGEERADYIARFQREAQAAGRCAHPNIVAIYDFALHDGNPYLAMEYVSGVTLHQIRARSGGLALPEVVSVAGQILDGLAHAHALGVVHRDIKPANVMLSEQGQVKVTDFGISRLDTSTLTGAGGVVGTPSYMSPEQCRGDAVDARSDLFSVGVVLYELVTGAKPFAGTSQHEVWHKLLHENPPDSASLRPDAPAALHAAIHRALSKRPLDRFQTAEAMASAIRGDNLTTTLQAFARDADRTVLQSDARAMPPGLDLDSSAMTSIERRLARHVGPIAGYLLRSAVRKAGTIDTLYDALAGVVPDGAARDQFRNELRLEVSASHTRSGNVVSLSEAELARAQTELAHHVGPIARLLVKRAAPGCSDLRQLWQRLSENLEGAHRASFLAKLNGDG